MKRVVVFGVFDLLHPGHLYFLQAAKRHGNHLTVVVTRDARVFHEKRRTPVFNERERLEMVRALHIVDNAILGDRAGEWKVLKKLKPRVVCLGYDQHMEWIAKCKLKKLPQVTRIGPYKSNRYSSTRVKYA